MRMWCEGLWDDDDDDGCGVRDGDDGDDGEVCGVGVWRMCGV